MSIIAGTYRARAIGQCVLGESPVKGTPFIEVYFQILEGEHKGSRVRWTSYFTDTRSRPGVKTPAERTIATMQIMGWDGEDLGEFADSGLHGLDANEVDIVVELEDYEDRTTGERKAATRVKWVNRAGGHLNTESAMKEASAVAFGDKYRGLALKIKAANPVSSREDSSFDFGANDPRPDAPIASNPPTSNGRKMAF